MRSTRIAAFCRALFECVPKEVWWDNPTTVAVDILKGRKRKLNDRYAALASHYTFEPLFCMPARGNEKPHVENRVKWLQRRWATPVPKVTVTKGQRELPPRGRHRAKELPPHRIRGPGAGRPRLLEQDPSLLADLLELVDSTTRGDPNSPLLWTCKSTRRLAKELVARGHQLTHVTVAHLLEQAGYSLQANHKTKEGNQHTDRNAQFEHINRQVQAFQERGQPVISVDTKAKELVGNFKQKGREWRPKGQPDEVRAKDFPDPQLGKVVPEGVYDLTRNEGWVSVGIDHDTAELAGATIRRWWRTMGSRVHPLAKELLITADAGGSNG